MIFTPRAGFRYPIEPAARTAVLVSWFGSNWFSKSGLRTLVRTFPQGWCEAAISFSPAALAATRDQLLELAVNPPRLTHALIVLKRAGEPMLSADDREALWRAFRVPLFEQIIGPRGELLAAECEAHDGLHIEHPGFLSTSYAVLTTLCACGRATPRLVRAQVVDPVQLTEHPRSVAAYAR